MSEYRGEIRVQRLELFADVDFCSIHRCVTFHNPSLTCPSNDVHSILQNVFDNPADEHRIAVPCAIFSCTSSALRTGYLVCSHRDVELYREFLIYPHTHAFRLPVSKCMHKQRDIALHIQIDYYKMHSFAAAVSRLAISTLYKTRSTMSSTLSTSSEHRIKASGQVSPNHCNTDHAVG